MMTKTPEPHPSRVLVALFYLGLPLIKPVLKGTVRRNRRIWRKLQAARDRIVASEPLDVGLEAAFPRRFYASAFYLVGAPVRRVLKKGLGRTPVWRRLSSNHRRLLGSTVPPWPPSAIEGEGGLKGRAFGVNIAGYFGSPSGTGETARVGARLLHAAGVPSVLNNVVGPSSREAGPGDTLSSENPYAINLMYVNPDQVAVFAWDKGEAYFRGHYNIGVWNWELTTFPPDWQPRFRYFNEIWVASDFVRDALAQVSPVPVLKMPFAIDSDPARTQCPDLSSLSPTPDAFLYLFVFDHHSIFERKNPLGLIEAFKRAFAPQEQTALVIKSIHADEPALRLMHRAAEGANVRIMNSVLSRDEIYGLFHRCDCYVSLHRSEGFGLTMAEAMAAGKPVIATDYSGNTDFLTPDTGYPVRFRLKEIDRDRGPYKKGQFWAEPDLDHAAALMRLVYEDRQHGQEIGRRAREQILALYHPDVVRDLMRRRVLAVASEKGIAMPEGQAHLAEGTG